MSGHEKRQGIRNAGFGPTVCIGRIRLRNELRELERRASDPIGTLHIMGIPKTEKEH